MLKENEEEEIPPPKNKKIKKIKKVKKVKIKKTIEKLPPKLKK
jgi:hypothetical protein